ncbi:MAG: hypothetical protein WCF79_12340, partial [Rhodomicrobium sp.]
LVAGWNSGSRGRTHFELGISNSFEGLPAPFGTNLYRIAQEAITNAAKHAEATRIWLNLCMRKADAAATHPSAYEIELTVTDDGKASPPIWRRSPEWAFLACANALWLWAAA